MDRCPNGPQIPRRRWRRAPPSQSVSNIQKSTSPIKDKYLDYIPDKIEEVKGQDYRLCLWLLYDQGDGPPDKTKIPLIAQYELKLMHDHLRKVCKFRDILLRFVPVKMTNYKTSKVQKKAA